MNELLRVDIFTLVGDFYSSVEVEWSHKWESLSVDIETVQRVLKLSSDPAIFPNGMIAACLLEYKECAVQLVITVGKLEHKCEEET